MSEKESGSDWSDRIKESFKYKLYSWKKYAGELNWNYFSIVETNGLEPKVKLKISIQLNVESFSGIISVFDKNLLKFNRLLKVDDLEFLFGDENLPDEEEEQTEEGLPEKIALAELKLIQIAIKILE